MVPARRPRLWRIALQPGENVLAAWERRVAGCTESRAGIPGGTEGSGDRPRRTLRGHPPPTLCQRFSPRFCAVIATAYAKHPSERKISPLYPIEPEQSRRFSLHHEFKYTMVREVNSTVQ